MADPAVTDEERTLHERPAELLRRLLRFDTTNPPGNEGLCAGWIAELLTAAGCAVKVLAKVDGRPNLVARIAGRGDAPPLLLQGHIDVVTTEGQDWRHPPFDAVEADGYIWGRGALDMKGGVAMMLAAFLRMAHEGHQPPGDVILAVLCDEEAGSDLGAAFLVEEHSELFAGVRYAIGEFGGFTLEISGRRFYAIEVGEKQVCWMKAVVRGPGGHGSMPRPGGTMAGVAKVLGALDSGRLPVHITPVAERMIETIAGELGFPQALAFSRMANPRFTDRILDRLGDTGRPFDPLVHNTVSATIIKGGSKVNVVPSEVELELDGRLLPGQTPEDLERELRALVGDGVDWDLEVVRHEAAPPDADMGLFDTLAGILREADPTGVPMPLLLSGVSDARFFAQLGIQTYGFLPMQLPEEMNFTSLIHAADERIPTETMAFGTDCVYRALQQFH